MNIKQMKSRRSVLAAIAGAATVVAVPKARAQSAYASRTIRIIVPFPAGGTTDLLARIFAERLTPALGQSVIVENIGGAGGSLGADAVAKANPDGYTLLFHNLTFSSTTASLEVAGQARHNLSSFAPISLAANVPMVLIATPGIEARDLREFAAYAKKAPPPGLFYGSPGLGSMVNVAMEVFKRDAGVAVDHVPFRGTAPLIQELVAGRIQLGGDQLSTALPHIRSGSIRALATLADRRISTLPDVPTVRELGYPNMEFRGWNGFFAPARTPEYIIDRLQQEIAAVARQPSVQQRLSDIGAEAVGSTSADLKQVVSDQIDAVRPLITELKLMVR